MSMYHFSDSEALEHDVNTVPESGDFGRIEVDGQWYVPEEYTCRMIYHYDDLFPAESYYECDRCHDTIPDTGSTLNYCQNCGARVVYKETDDAN